MRLPRDLSGLARAKALARLGYSVDYQRGSHIRLTTQQPREHHITIPAHDPLKVGTLNAILREVADHAGLEREALLHRLFE